MRRYFALLILASLELFCVGASAQPRFAQYEVPCETESGFTARLRPLLRNPAQLNADLASVSLVIAEQSDQSWLLSVRRSEDGVASEPRTVRDRGCPALLEAATLVISAWLNEAAPVAQSAVPPQPLPRAVTNDAPVGYTLPKRTLSPPPTYGLAARLNGAAGMRASLSGGAALEFFRLSGGRLLRIGAGVDLWPTHKDLTLLDERYAAPIFEIHVSGTMYWLKWSSFRAGPFVECALGVRNRLDPAPAAPFIVPSTTTNQTVDQRATGRLSAGAALRLELNDSWSLGAQLGASLTSADVILGAFLAIGIEVSLS
jgi:hypothetical protein